MAEHLAKRKELWEARNSGKTFPENRDRGRPKEFAADTAEKTGVGKRAINMAFSRAQKLSPEVRDMIRVQRLAYKRVEAPVAYRAIHSASAASSLFEAKRMAASSSERFAF